MSMSPRERVGYVAIGALLLFGFGFVGARRMRQPTPIVFQSPSPALNHGSSSTAAVPETVVVHVAGAVKFPGVVRLNGSARVVDAIHAAGGPTSKADLESINLAAKLIDGSQLRVPTLYAATPTSSKSTPSRRPLTRPVAQIDKSGYFAPVEVAPEYLPKPEITPVASTTSATAEKQPSPHAFASKPSATEVDINTATLQDLQALPGVGASTAQKILDYRNQHGTFHSPDELLAVKGIGPKKLEKMKPFVRV